MSIAHVCGTGHCSNTAMLRHSIITTALDLAAKHGMGLEKVHPTADIAPSGQLLTYHDEHDRQGTQRRLSELVASTLASK